MLIRPIAEAISFADKVIVLSKRPAHIKKVFDIKLSKSFLPTEKRGCLDFNNYYKDIWKVFDHEV